MSKISAPQVRKALLDIITENPDRTNEGRCLYLKDDDVTPHCIAGVAFSRLRPKTLAEIGYNDNATVVRLLPERITSRFSQPALDVLNAAQVIADNDGDGDVPWADALHLVNR